MAVVQCTIALVTLTPQVPHLVRTLHSGKWLAMLTVVHGPKLALRGVTSHLVTDMCMYSHAIVGVSPHDYGRAMVGYICPTHTVSVTYKLGVTAAG